MVDMAKVIRIIDELIFEAQKEQTWKAENALRCLKKELLKDQEAVVRCKDCKHILPKGFCHKHSRKVTDNWFCADGEQK